MQTLRPVYILVDLLRSPDFLLSFLSVICVIVIGLKINSVYLFIGTIYIVDLNRILR